MKLSNSGKLFGILLTLLMVLSVSIETMGQGRSRRVSRPDKCAKFVNCHDARDGRWDGRGPNRGGVFPRIFRRNRRIWDRDIDVFNRRGRRDRDWDRDRIWRRRR